jgi:omega-amidase
VTALRVALGEYDIGWQEPERSLAGAEAVIMAAAGAGAQLVVLPEMALTGFTMEPAAQAEPLDGPHVRALARLAAGAGVELLASIARRDDSAGAPRFLNSVVHVGRDGEPRVVYDKQRLFSYGGEHECYTPGESSPAVLDVRGVRVAAFVCYDLRFPELFREVADDVDLVVVTANWPAARRPHWDALLRARAIENQCWLVGVNRTGTGGRLQFDGGSAAYDPWGERGDRAEGESRVVDVDTARVREIRERYPFLKDRLERTRA